MSRAKQRAVRSHSSDGTSCDGDEPPEQERRDEREPHKETEPESLRSKPRAEPKPKREGEADEPVGTDVRNERKANVGSPA